jgi:hypothetical protein
VTHAAKQKTAEDHSGAQACFTPSSLLCWGHLNIPKNCLRPGTRHMGYKHCSETA